MPEDRWIRVSEAEKVYDEIAVELGKVLAERMKEEFMYWRVGPVPECDWHKPTLFWDHGKPFFLDVGAGNMNNADYYMILKEPKE
jgi:hypothetical protein